MPGANEDRDALILVISSNNLRLASSVEILWKSSIQSYKNPYYSIIVIMMTFSPVKHAESKLHSAGEWFGSHPGMCGPGVDTRTQAMQDI